MPHITRLAIGWLNKQMFIGALRKTEGHLETQFLSKYRITCTVCHDTSTTSKAAHGVPFQNIASSLGSTEMLVGDAVYVKFFLLPTSWHPGVIVARAVILSAAMGKSNVTQGTGFNGPPSANSSYRSDIA